MPASFNATNLNDAGAGSLRQAISDANSSMDASSTITFTSGMSGTISLKSALDHLQKNITIQGNPVSGIAVLRDPTAATNFPIFSIDERTNCEIDWLNIEDGNQGGVVSGGTLLLNGCVVAQNVGGSGVANGAGQLTVWDCIIEFNQTPANGGGIDNVGGTVYSYGTTISYNNANNGGGIANDSQTSSITLDDNSQITYNYASQYGGGISNLATVTMTGGSLFSNTAGKGGGRPVPRIGRGAFYVHQRVDHLESGDWRGRHRRRLLPHGGRSHVQ